MTHTIEMWKTIFSLGFLDTVGVTISWLLLIFVGVAVVVAMGGLLDYLWEKFGAGNR